MRDFSESDKRLATGVATVNLGAVSNVMFFAK
jgi:hypothetical protein